MEKHLPPELFEHFASLARARTGIKIKRGKEQLVASRVSKRMRLLRLSSFQDYAHYLENSPGEMEHFINAMTTNLTRFYRESEHFDMLRSYLGGLVGKRVRMWCAASSTGQEVWTLAMVAHEVLGGGDWKLLATDIDTKVLATAKRGVYEHRLCEGIPAHQRSQYFQDNGNALRVGEVLRPHVSFARLNLATPPYPMGGPLDVVFCRNVMIYFELPVRTAIVRECERVMRPGGQLYLGHSESLAGINTPLTRSGPACYELKMQRKAA